MKGQSAQSRPTTVEILGPPGSGKTAVYEALQDSGSDIVPVSIYWRKPENLSVGVRSAFSIAPILFDRASNSTLSVNHVVWMIRLQAALPIFHRQLVTPPSIVTFDQGPVFTMVRLQPMALLAADGSRLRRWWELKLDDWARTLDLLVLLDAPNEVLTERIRKRSKSHVAKTQSDERVGELLMNERTGYEAVAEALNQRRVMQVLRLDTSARSVDEITSEVVTALRAAQSFEGRL
jgi:broad-specificity NMP kinase